MATENSDNSPSPLLASLYGLPCLSSSDLHDVDYEDVTPNHKSEPEDITFSVNEMKSGTRVPYESP